jgi:hypothetical protein
VHRATAGEAGIEVASTREIARWATED